MSIRNHTKFSLTIIEYYDTNYVKISTNIMTCYLKGELGEIQIYFRNIPLHQQKFLVVSVLFNSIRLGCREI